MNEWHSHSQSPFGIHSVHGIDGRTDVYVYSLEIYGGIKNKNLNTQKTGGDEHMYSSRIGRTIIDRSTSTCTLSRKSTFDMHTRTEDSSSCLCCPVVLEWNGRSVPPGAWTRLSCSRVLSHSTTWIIYDRNLTRSMPPLTSLATAPPLTTQRASTSRITSYARTAASAMPQHHARTHRHTYKGKVQGGGKEEVQSLHSTLHSRQPD